MIDHKISVHHLLAFKFGAILCVYCNRVKCSLVQSGSDRDETCRDDLLDNSLALLSQGDQGLPGSSSKEPIGCRGESQRVTDRDPVALRPNQCNLRLAIFLSAQNAKLSLVLHTLKCDLGDVETKTLLCCCIVIPI